MRATLLLLLLALTGCDSEGQPYPCVRHYQDGGCDVFIAVRQCGYVCPRDYVAAEDAGSCPLSDKQCN